MSIYNFGDIVVVEKNLVGVVVKCWHNMRIGYHYDIYVRSFNDIREYKENDIKKFIYDKELSKESLEYYD